jgi:5-formyltetrahydrofolate cyclo-ligase
LQSLSYEEKQKSSLQIQKNLSSELKSERGIWAGYMPLATEPVIEWIEAAPQLTWAFPVASGECLKFKIPTKGFKRAALGFQEPVGDEVELTEISGFIIPGLGFDKSGYRLGRGGGYYDRTLKNSKKNKLGVCFEVSLLNDLPFEDHDVRCDKIITEKQVYVVKTAEGEQKWN